MEGIAGTIKCFVHFAGEKIKNEKIFISIKIDFFKVFDYYDIGKIHLKQLNNMCKRGAVAIR